MHFGGFFLLSLLVFCLQVEWITGGMATEVEVNYEVHERSETSLPAEDYVQLLRRRGIDRIRLHDTNSDLLRALGSAEGGKGLSPIEVIVGVRNDEIIDIAGSSSASAHRWVARNVVPYFPQTKIIAVAVGNDVLTTNSTEENDSLIPFLVPAMKNIHIALSSVGLERLIKVSAPQSLMVLSSYSPAASAAFDSSLVNNVMYPLLEFLRGSESFFMLNLYPENLHRQNGGGGLRNEDSLHDSVVPTAPTRNHDLHDREELHQENLYNTFVDSVVAAMALLNHGEVDVVLTETRSLMSSFDVDIIVNLPKPLKRGGQVGDSPVEVRVKLAKMKPVEFSNRRMMGTLKPKPTKDVVQRRKLADKSWCVANPNADSVALQAGLDWACGPGMADCTAIQKGGSCFIPNTLVSHASYAYNSYYQKQAWATGSCDFGNTARVTSTDPSNPSCLYSSSTSASGSPSTPTGTIVPSANNNFSSLLQWDRRLFFITTILIAFIVYGALV